MDSTARLNHAQSKLDESGFVDLKFFFSFDQQAKSDVQDSLAAMVEGFLSGKCRESTFDDEYLIPA